VFPGSGTGQDWNVATLPTTVAVMQSLPALSLAARNWPPGQVRVTTTLVSSRPVKVFTAVYNPRSQPLTANG
jgi:hypothetical protein